MFTCRNWLALSLAAIVGSYALTQAPPTADVERVQALIKQLGSTKSSEREKASRDLEALGAPALEHLKKAIKEADLETSRRAEVIVKRLEERIGTASLLTPKRVRLKVTDMAVLDAVNELAKVSGYAIQVQGDRTVLAGKKVTLDTGDTTFWEALDQLCAKAGLSESTSTPNINLVPPGIRPVPPIRIRPPRVVPAVPAVPAVPLPAPAPQADPAVPLPADKPAPAAPEPAPKAVPLQGQVELIQPVAEVKVEAIQVQAQPAQAQPVQVQIFPAIEPAPGFGRFTPQSGTIILTPTPGKTQPTSYAGAVRVRVVKNLVKKEAGHHVITLDAAAEPRLQGFRILGAPTIEKAVDDQDQTLTSAVAPAGQGNAQPGPDGGVIIVGPGGDVMPGFPGGMQNPRQAMVRLKAGAKNAKVLKELKGQFNAEVVVPNEMLVEVTDVLKAAGQTAKGKNGAALTVQSIEKLANGDYKLKIHIENPPQGNPFGGGVIMFQQAQMQIQIGGGGGLVHGLNSNGLPELVDAKGNKYQVVQIPSRGFNANNGQVTQDVTMVFRANKGQGEPARLVLYGNRMTTIQIPFAFKDVPLD